MHPASVAHKQRIIQMCERNQHNGIDIFQHEEAGLPHYTITPPVTLQLTPVYKKT